MKSRRKEKRPYRSALRERQQEDTREAILKALGEQIVRSGPGEFSLPEVAARAGVNVRTVYRHFGSRELLGDALQAWVVRRASPPMPQSLEELVEVPPVLFGIFDEHAPWVEAMVKAGHGSGVRAAGRASRVALFRALTADAVKTLPDAEANAVQALVKHLVSPETWLAMRQDFGVDGPTAGRAVSRTLRALFQGLEKKR